MTGATQTELQITRYLLLLYRVFTNWSKNNCFVCIPIREVQIVHDAQEMQSSVWVKNTIRKERNVP